MAAFGGFLTGREAAKYMKGLDINLTVDVGNGKKSFTVYTINFICRN